MLKIGNYIKVPRLFLHRQLSKARHYYAFLFFVLEGVSNY